MTITAVVANIIAAEEHLEEVQSQLEALVASTAAEEGTKQYVLHQDTADAASFWVYEVYADQAAFDAHMGSDTMASVMVALGDKLGGPLALHVLKPVKAKGLEI